MSCWALIVSVRSGGRKKKLKTRALTTAVPTPIQRPQTVAISSTPGMKTMPSETGSAIDSSAAAIPVPIATTTIAARKPSAVEGALAEKRNTPGA